MDFMLKCEKVAHVAKLQGELLREHSIGHPDWYAEMLVCAALDGQLAPTNTRYYDVSCQSYGRVQIKCRVDGTDTTQNRTNFGKYKVNDFEHAAIVIFEKNYKIKGAVILPVLKVLALVRAAGHVKWDDVRRDSSAICIAAKLKSISGE
jgi:hypothetical protein